ncbi:TetR/AcrR family transcriptional regulator [Virgibacillus sp. AGTR]|uniref:TetR/AcrR family transcriptional regulator n=1 Tax=unclassified Virgibacillus TaxID=2620237 RepID=UPI001D15E6F9|nr:MULTISPECIES: TetR/AcrR family transcriptional regulator [unclassified Virgibacillus]MCC2250294.1 TetR/AcrR family transcriptional regulator [Virgibacillus sp. AGTR]MDY7043572.1 TetR/AcrR family transcriptional regulator [Virgibacillus sp. M23]
MARITKSTIERRNEILDMAEKLFSEKGYDKTSTTDITKGLGVAQGTLYYHFASKEILAQELVNRQLQILHKHFRDVLLRTDLTAYEKLAWIFIYELDDPLNHVEIFSYLRNDHNSLLRQIVYVQTICQFSPMVTEMILQGNQEGIFKVETPALIAEFFLSTIHHWVDSSLFSWTNKEKIARITALQSTFEHLFGLEKNQLDLNMMRKVVAEKIL